MAHGRLGDVATGVVGDAAGTVVDPKQGLQRLKGGRLGPALVVVGVALVVGYLIGRWSRR
ncbi:hypothetical protein BDK92_6450 [Micromonospora pisi]|uniref:Uncharacterized protein n=1 Tax=Micromonospora pisi TaxID=589240 RepID=A0A495JTZ6_9ACTN|nr:hypothetical protein [Micromonospora pisi]RKR92018.1 hypothetical protein BDK92_6450 [Micromonospora pisi]